MIRIAAGAVSVVLAGLTLQPPPPGGVKPSQHGTVTQQVAGTTITVDYNRPVARGRNLFGAPPALVPYDRVWCPGADECTTITLSTDVTLEGHALRKGTYTLWANPGAATWSMIVNPAHPLSHPPHHTVPHHTLL